MFHLAHISDLHLPFTISPSFFELFGKRAIGYCNWKFNRSHHLTFDIVESLLETILEKSPDHLAITGDIVNLSLKSEFERAKKWLLRWGNPENISLTLGNHDAYTLGAFQNAINYFENWLNTKEENFKTNPFPFCRVQSNVAIIRISSAIPSPFFCALGYVSKRQQKILTKLLRETKEQNLFRVVLIHHPPVINAASPLKKLCGISNLQKIFLKEGCELILHGHTHLPTLNYLKGPKETNIPTVGISSAAQNIGGKKPASGYNWFEIFKQKEEWHCNLSRYILQKNKKFVFQEKESIL